jgi:hypothetical protein
VHSRPPCSSHVIGVAGIIVGALPILMKATLAGHGVPLRHFATQGAAYMAIFSALVWVMSAMHSMRGRDSETATLFTNAMAACYAASAAIFTSASFVLEGTAGMTVPLADEIRIPTLFGIATALPVILSVGLVYESCRRK